MFRCPIHSFLSVAESRNWTGLCIEPIPEVFARLRSNRHCSVRNCCILDEEKEVTFRSVFPPLEMLSGILEFFDQRHIDRINAEVSIIADGLLSGYYDSRTQYQSPLRNAGTL